MPSEKKKVTLIPDHDALAVCGRDIRPGESGRWSDASQQITGLIRRHALLTEQAPRELDAVLSADEWNLIADVNNGCADLWDYSESSIPYLSGIAANVEDGDRLDGTGAKWGVDVPELLRRLAALARVHGEAIADAVRWFWDRPEAIAHTVDHWWLPAFRRKAVREGE